ncbi:hypothetical protein HMN09_00916700 [Mycena chlorophos]|uniref:Uncharacterized protein n=1 Tax=Mycena chlorophos TaxID=658473 RepID=A0A8H6SJ62_MYCCL|nr:hypothetical protein HMN09_00916700 [Mycena chlorophos]
MLPNLNDSGFDWETTSLSSVPGSIRSWWSDSNSLGATVSIHAAAKPLVAFLHHREARRFLRKWGGRALTGNELKTLLSYVSCYAISYVLQKQEELDLDPVFVQRILSDLAESVPRGQEFDAEVRREALLGHIFADMRFVAQLRGLHQYSDLDDQVKALYLSLMRSQLPRFSRDKVFLGRLKQELDQIHGIATVGNDYSRPWAWNVLQATQDVHSYKLPKVE